MEFTLTGGDSSLVTVKQNPPNTPVEVICDNGRCSCNNRCGLTTFEGGESVAPIPPIPLCVTLASFPDWLFLEGGNIGNWPSPDTVAFWIGGATREITFQPAVASVSFFYTSAVNVTLEAFDANNTLIASVVGPANVFVSPFDRWDPLGVNAGSNRITRIRITGNSNQTAIDNLKVCSVRRTCCKTHNPFINANVRQQIRPSWKPYTVTKKHTSKRGT
ncbi:hypothetical protein [Parageobacillus toebii]|uniref:hypothetical protein n=1 Tax=Parageobacillus toebii TaxID=153151 RepID=UPI0019678D16|nr:hypothetical protein [Parageobacillus toebii]QSB47970.1 hypothetical protein JTI59_12535 [Parageobacillus toebii]